MNMRETTEKENTIILNWVKKEFDYDYNTIEELLNETDEEDLREITFYLGIECLNEPIVYDFNKIYIASN